MKKIKTILIATCIVFSMVLSMTNVFGEYEKLDSKTPGIDIWEGGGYLIDAIDTNDILTTDTKELQFGKTIDIEVNDSLDWSEPHYFIWYPVYTGNIGESYDLSWEKWKPESGPAPTIGGTDFTFEDVYLNISGLWLIDNNNDHDTSSISLMNDTIPAWFWVSGTEILDIHLSDDTVYYQEDIDITVNVSTDGKFKPVLIDVRNDDSIFNQGNIWADDPNGEITFSTTNFTHAGDYTVYAYRDYDDNEIYYQENPKYYNETYGDGTVDADKYNYTTCGPWDPPEYFAKEKIITVETAEPNMELKDGNKVYWGFKGTLKVNVTDNDDKGLENGIIKIKNRHGDYLETMLPALNITNLGEGDYQIDFARGATNWNMLDTGSVNGTWYVIYSEDIDFDGIEEWNDSIAFTVAGSAPGAQIEITNDGDGDDTDMEVNIPDYIEDEVAPLLQINFTIYGKEIDGPNAYYGDNDWEDEDNITISGNILFTPSVDDNTLINHGDGTWTVNVTPTQPGEISIAIDWEENGTDSQTIEIKNGTYVSSDINSFIVDKNATLYVYVKNVNENNEEFADIYLFWADNGEVINHTEGDGKTDNGKNGIYKFIIDKEQQRGLAPQDIIITANTPALGYWGYNKVKMAPNSDLVVTCNKNSSYAGDSTFYDITISTLDGDEPENSHLVVDLYDEDDDIIWSYSGSREITDEEIILGSGEYRFYAHNKTHDSKGNNDTLVIYPYVVTCSPGVFAWLIDDNINATFTVSPAGDGDLKIYNMSGDYETSIDNEYLQIEIENGTGTIKGINASELGLIEFNYQPYSGEYKKADGSVRVTTATATPSPSKIYVNEPEVVSITITHPATGKSLPDVDVRLESNILQSVPEEATTDERGKVEFGITSGASGDIIILIEGDYDEDNKFVIKSLAKKAMTIDAPLSVDEKEIFTVSFKSGSDLITDVVTVHFNGETHKISTGSIQLTAPEVSIDLDYRITASADEYGEESFTIRVLNNPQLMIICDMLWVFVNEEFSLIISDDTGQGIIGAKVTFNNQEYTSSVNGKLTLKAPENPNNYTISASFDNFHSTSKVIQVKQNQTPGFEILTFVISLGIALILLKRKKPKL